MSVVGHNFRKVLITPQEKKRKEEKDISRLLPIKLHHCADWQKSAHIFYRQLRYHYRRTKVLHLADRALKFAKNFF